MSSLSTSLTLPTVIQVIERVLKEYSEDLYQLAFSVYGMRQKLITHVLNHIPSHYTVEELQESSSSSKAQRPPPLDMLMQIEIEIVVHESILCILRENADELGCMIPHANTENKTVISQSFKGKTILLIQLDM
jgi:hypothetical protein